MKKRKAKKVYLRGRLVPFTDLTALEQEIEGLLQEERALQRQFYIRMSGEITWKPGQKAEFLKMFEQLSLNIKALQSERLLTESQS